MLLIDAFRSRRQLAARGRPLRAPSRQLRGGPRLALAAIYVVELALVFGAGGAHVAVAVVAAVAGLVACHVLAYVVESRPGNRKTRAATAA